MSGRRVLVPEDIQLELDVGASDTPATDIYLLPVNSKPQVFFRGQQPVGTKAFVLNALEHRSLLEGGTKNLACAIHPLLTSAGMLNSLNVDRWIIDIEERKESEARGKYPRLMKYLEERARPDRQCRADAEAETNRRLRAADPHVKVKEPYKLMLEKWWQLGYRRPALLAAVQRGHRYIVTAKTLIQDSSIFTFVDSTIRSDDSLSVYALNDDYSLGVLSSRVHSTWIEARRRDPKRGARRGGAVAWKSFPWPQTPSVSDVATIAGLASSILAVRAEQLNGAVALSDQYGLHGREQSRRLTSLTAELDCAVLAAYGFRNFEQVAKQLETLNRAIAGGPAAARGPGSERGEARASDYRLLRPNGPQTQ